MFKVLEFDAETLDGHVLLRLTYRRNDRVHDEGHPDGPIVSDSFIMPARIAHRLSDLLLVTAAEVMKGRQVPEETA